VKRYKNLILFLVPWFFTELTGVQAQTVKDIDGNVYHTITIGTQVWLKENLRTTRFCNGDSINTTIPDTLDITTESMPKYQWIYDGKGSNNAKYGRLYTWYTITDSRKICPKGWHVPTDVDWTTLTDYLKNHGNGYNGSIDEIAKSMAAISDWNIDSMSGNIGNDQKSNNSSGFSAFAGGYRYGIGIFNGVGIYGYWWSATEDDAKTASYFNLSAHRSNVFRGSTSKQNGVSVRCVKDL
jgi:uncharacterized protein (TIGR02145 family)